MSRGKASSAPEVVRRISAGSFGAFMQTWSGGLLRGEDLAGAQI